MNVFLGKWKSESTEGFEDYLKALGVGMALRKIASIQNPCVEVTDNGDGSYTIKQITTFKTHAVDFVLDKELEENTPDGRKVKTTFSMDGDKLVQRQMTLDGNLSSELTREIVDGKLKCTATAGDAVYIRVYAKE